nr:C2 calcium/lipid-binding domain, CaLB [Tanacetum cinerariifolium]
MSGMDDDLFTYKVEVANIPCDSNKDDDSEQRMSQEANDDMGYDPSDVAFTEWLGSKFFNYKMMDHYTKKALWIHWIRGDDEVELTDEEFSDNEDEVAKESHKITYHDHDEIGYKNETHDEIQELCEAYKLPVCNIRKLEMIKYSFGQDEEYVAVKEDKYDDLARTSDDAC